MVLFRAAFPVFRGRLIPAGIDRVAVLVKGIHVGTADVEVVVGAVEVGDGQVTHTDLF